MQKETGNTGSMGTLAVAKALHPEEVGQEVWGAWEAHLEVLQYEEKVVWRDAVGVQAHQVMQESVWVY